jgi:hypothetical protein
MLNAKKSSIKNIITFMVSLSTSKHRENNSYKHKKKWRKLMNNNSNGGAITRCEILIFKK